MGMIMGRRIIVPFHKKREREREGAIYLDVVWFGLVL
jgi:hypothetical protein